MDPDSFKIALPDGRNLDICTTSGADEFLGHAFIDKFFSQSVEQASKIREKENRGKKLKPNEKEQLKLLIFSLNAIARYSNPELFRSKIPASEIECLMDHIIGQLKKKKEDSKWIRTGALEDHDSFLLNCCISLFMKEVPTNIAFEKEFFQVLADLLVAAQDTAKNFPSDDIAETVTLMISNALVSTFCQEGSSGGGGTRWTPEKVFKRLEACGILQQYIQCSSVSQPSDDVDFPRGVGKVYDELLSCTSFLRKKFRVGEPCGDTVRAILSGKGRYRRRGVVEKLEAIVRHADFNPSNKDGDFKNCRYCNKMELSDEFQQALKKCSRCLNAFYCSRECQVADWKTHKKVCFVATNKHEKTYESSQQTLMDWAQRNILAIMVKLVDACDETDLSKNEMVVEVDFQSGDDASAPALQDPPKFKIAESRTYFEGDRRNEPDWFGKPNEEVYTSNVTGFRKAVKYHYARLTSSHLLFVVRFPFGASCFKVNLMSKNDLAPWFTDEVVHAFRKGIREDDFSLLEQRFGEDEAKRIRKELWVKHQIGEPDEETLDQVRSILNRAFGADF